MFRKRSSTDDTTFALQEIFVRTRRIVTGHSPAGKAIVVSDGYSPWTVDALHIPLLRTELLWQTSDPLTLASSPAADPALTATTFLPKAGATSVQVVTFPPDATAMPVDARPAELGDDYAKAFPGLADLFERDNPGMHITETVDYCVLLDGELEMELDDGVTTVLRRSDIVVQNGTRHGWRNRSAAPARMLFVMIGAHAAS